jgi:hypothetical protein
MDFLAMTDYKMGAGMKGEKEGEVLFLPKGHYESRLLRDAAISGRRGFLPTLRSPRDLAMTEWL